MNRRFRFSLSSDRSRPEDSMMPSQEPHEVYQNSMLQTIFVNDLGDNYEPVDMDMDEEQRASGSANQRNNQLETSAEAPKRTTSLHIGIDVNTGRASYDPRMNHSADRRTEAGSDLIKFDVDEFLNWSPAPLTRKQKYMNLSINNVRRPAKRERGNENDNGNNDGEPERKNIHY